MSRATKPFTWKSNFGIVSKRLGERLPKQSSNVLRAADVCHTKLPTDILSTSIFFRGAIPSGYMKKTSCVMLRFRTSQEVYTKFGTVLVHQVIEPTYRSISAIMRISMCNNIFPDQFPSMALRSATSYVSTYSLPSKIYKGSQVPRQ